VGFRRLTPHLLFVVGVATLLLLGWQARPGDIRSAHRGPLCDSASTVECAALAVATNLPAEERLAARHAPVVYLPELDRPCRPGGSSYAPIPVEAVLDNHEVAVRKLSNPGFFGFAPGAADLYELGGREYFDLYIDLPGSPSRPGCRYERDALRFSSGLPHVAYARITTDESFDGLILQYWLFYYFNDWNNKHEADWELVQLYFDVDDPRAALMVQPVSIAISQHSSGNLAAWNDSRVHREGDRPVIYVARGSHANYFEPGVFLGRGEQGRGLGCDDASLSNRRISLEARLLPDRINGPNDPYAWLAFKGYWGEVVPGVTEGSTALATKQSWLHPYTWQQRLDQSTVALPSQSFIGFDAATTFCDLVAFGSSFLLPLYHDMPALSLLAFAATSIGIAGSLARTRYLPISLRPLRSRRRLGQVLTTAAELYRSRLYVFIALALLAFPAGFALSLARQAVPGLEASSLLSVMPLSGSGAEYLAALAVNSLALIGAAVLVLAAVTAAVGATERGDPPDATHAFLVALQRLPRVLLARSAALVMIAGLCVTIAGIPLAVRQALRWAFVEQAILIEDKGAREALRASSSLVSGRGARAALALAGIWLAVLCAAPAFGIVLLWTFKAVPLAYVNLATSAFWALLVSYAAVALTLLYYDLATRRDEQP
jgi:hypothetical protein